MRIAIVGGGPAGLYLAILLKRADPAHEVTVVERNPAGATYGWGVVFSEETLTELRDADYETFVHLDDHLVRWNAIDIRYRTTVTRCYGHGFSAIRRTALLGVLQEQARALGADLRFEEEVDGATAFPDHDVIVAADGVRSAVRAGREGDFGTTAQETGATFAWFGTDLVFDVFTFIFRETEHGLFTVHAYPFDAGTSTFIVECRPETWRSAGLDEMTEEESLRYCEELFADHLGDHRLMSNRSLWSRFQTVRNRRWRDGNVVLVGDAAATAHFSIGSGTKLALEDAIALAKALRAHDSLDAAFAEYELERQLPTERFQDAAVDSAQYFATVDRYLGFAPEQFACNLLTRSGRVTYNDLTRRDPVFTNAVDRWFRAEQAGDPTARTCLVTAGPGTAPLELGGTALPNRVVLACPPLDRADGGHVGAIHAGQLAALVDARPGLVTTELVAISPEGRVTPGSPGLWTDEQTAAWRDVLERARGTASRDAIAGDERGADSAGPSPVAVRLGHAGRRGATRPRHTGLDRPLREGGWELLAPSPLPYLSRSPVPIAVDEGAAERLVEAAGRAAANAATAGFDVLLLDWSDGYLLASFLSPLTNRRDDGSGGDLSGRLRFPLAVLDAVRSAWPAERPLAVRLNADDRRPGGFGLDDAVHVARALVGRSVAFIDVVAGHTVPDGAAAPDYRRGFLVGLSTAIRNEAQIRTLTSGRLTTLDDVETVVASGRADLALLDPAAYRRSPVTRWVPGGQPTT
jgi:anthraniloyl-CoA monooxygenase